MNKLTSFVLMTFVCLFYVTTAFAIKVNLFNCSGNKLISPAKRVDVSDKILSPYIKFQTKSETIFTIKYSFSGNKLLIARTGISPIDKSLKKRNFVGQLENEGSISEYICDKYDYDNDLENCNAVKYFRRTCGSGDMLAIFVSKMLSDEGFEKTLSLVK